MNDPREIWFSTSPMGRNLLSQRQDDPSGFDGNRSDIISSWLFPRKKALEDEEGVIDTLMELTVEGNLRWALFPTVVPL